MYAAVEHGPVLCSDSNILCLSWKGRVPKSEKEKPVCRRRYYEEGWLATGNGRGVVGVTFTSSHCRRDRSTPQRINFNLRGHNSEVSCGFVLLFVWLLPVVFQVPQTWNFFCFSFLATSETSHHEIGFLCSSLKGTKVDSVHGGLCLPLWVSCPPSPWSPLSESGCCLSERVQAFGWCPMGVLGRWSYSISYAPDLHDLELPSAATPVQNWQHENKNGAAFILYN